MVLLQEISNLFFFIFLIDIHTVALEIKKGFTFFSLISTYPIRQGGEFGLFMSIKAFHQGQGSYTLSMLHIPNYL